MIYTPTNGQLDSLMALGQKIAERARKERKIAAETRAIEIQRLKDFRAMQGPVTLTKAAFCRTLVKPWALRDADPATIDAMIDEGMACVKAGGILQEVANKYGVYRETLTYYMRTRRGYRSVRKDQKKPFTEKDRKEALRLRAGGMIVREIAKRFGMGPTALRTKVNFPPHETKRFQHH